VVSLKSSKVSAHRSEVKWWLFCLAIVVFKLLLLAIEPLPKLYLGDSISYLHTAVFKWIPDDRSFVYGYVIKWLCLRAQSLTPLLIVQSFLGGSIAVIVAWICRVIFNLPENVAYVFGFLCAIDPLQIVWERYVMTETWSLFFYALMLQQSFVYLRNRRLGTLVLIQFLAILTIGFRTSFFITVQLMAWALPLIAFLNENATAITNKSWDLPRLHFLKRARFWRHLAVSLTTMFLLDQAYQQTYGFLSHREPAHLHGSGYFLLAAWAPILKPSDASDPRLAEIIKHGDEFGLGDITQRNAQRFFPGRIVDRWCRTETDPRKSNEIATQTALNALRRDPLAVVALAAKTYFDFWTHASRKMVKSDLGGCCLNDKELATLANTFHWASRADLRLEPQSLTQWYYVKAWQYMFLVLLSPFLSLALVFAVQNKQDSLLILFHTTLLLSSMLVLSLYPVPRFLQPLSLLTLLSFALAVKSCLHRQRTDEGQVVALNNMLR
jgi:hypothetical protein